MRNWELLATDTRKAAAHAMVEFDDLITAELEICAIKEANFGDEIVELMKERVSEDKERIGANNSEERPDETK